MGSYFYSVKDLKSVKRVRNPKDFPKGAHFAAIVYDKKSVYFEGDERSRNNPGHGYPAHSEDFDTFEHYVTTNREEWERLVVMLMGDEDAKDNFVAFEVSRVPSIKVQVILE
jgi:hypothetical protein